MLPKFKKTFYQRSKAVTATCFDCNNTIGFNYDITMNIETNNITFFSTEYTIPNPKIRCPRCKKEMEIYGNSVGRMNGVFYGAIDPSKRNDYQFSIKYEKGKNTGRKVVNHEIVQTYEYPYYQVKFNNRPEYWNHIYDLILSIPLDDDFKYEEKPIIDAIIQMIDENTCALTFSFIKDRLIDKYMIEEDIEEISFEMYFSMKFSDYLNYIACELQNLLNLENGEREHSFI